jgi:heme-degrading monooxygenase HmoA
MIVELRQYTLRPGQRDVLIELFDGALAEGQEAVGITLIGWFRDLDDPDQFVWLRSFRDMQDRARALAAFYDGPVWAEHRGEANATMIASENVLLLRPAGNASVPSLKNQAEPIVVSIHYFPEPVDDDALERLERELGPARAVFVTEESPNNFPRLPVREGEHVVVRFSSRADPGAHEVLRLQR